MTETLEVEVRRGPLAQTFSLFEPSTLQHAHEAMALRDVMPHLRNEFLWTADFSMYRVEDKEEFFYFAPREHNLLFRALEFEETRLHAINQLLTTQNYIPPKAGIEEVVTAASAGKALKIKILDLELVKDNDEYGHFDVDPDNLDSLNPAQKQLVQAIYGTSKPGNKVYVLTSEYVKKKLEGKEDSAIARASGLGWADWGSWFVADGRGVVSVFYGLLGVLKEAPKAPQKIDSATGVSPMAYDEALKLAEKYAPKNSPLFPVLRGFLDTVYRKS